VGFSQGFQIIALVLESRGRLRVGVLEHLAGVPADAFGALDQRLERLLDLSFDRVDSVVVEDTVVPQVRLEPVDRIALAPALDFLVVPVDAGIVRRRVCTVPVLNRLDRCRPQPVAVCLARSPARLP